MNREKFLRYSPLRDVVFVFGAGASNPDGVPLQKELLPMIISGENQEISKSEIGKIVIDFIKENFEFDPVNNVYPQLEGVFGFIDYFIQLNESLNVKYTTEKIRQIREYLIKIIHYVVNLRTDGSSPFYHKFWNISTNLSQNFSVITLNYDTLLEQAFDFIFKSKKGLIDYCIPLMNYEKLPQLSAYNFWINTREPVKIIEEENPYPYKIVKIHGSLNWKYCNCCNQTLLTPWDRKIDLNQGKFLGYSYPENEEYEYQCPLDATEFQTMIVPPSHVKSLQHPVISQLMNEAAKEIRSTKKIVFVGYSLSDADIHIKALFKKNISPETSVYVINTKKRDSMVMNYKSLDKNVRFKCLSFEELVNDESHLSEIFS